MLPCCCAPSSLPCCFAFESMRRSAVRHGTLHPCCAVAVFYLRL
jgi:hypothetical protein